MRVLVSDILARIDAMPADFRDHVQVDHEDKSLAYVRSFSSDEMYTVHIGVHKDDPGDKSILNTTCPCDSRTLCKHVTAFYAVSKGLGPSEKLSDAPETEPTPETVQIHVEDKCERLRALTMAAIDTDLKAHEARVAMLLEVERIARGE